MKLDSNRHWREVLSWDTSIYNPSDHMDGLRELMKLLDSEGIPFTLIKDPLGYTKRQVISIKNDKVELNVHYVEDEYALYKKDWININRRPESSIKELLNDIKSEL